MATEYNMADYESDDDDGEGFPDPPPDQNLFSAALFLQNLLASNDVPHAVTGGFSLRLRGGDRRARQIDFAVQPAGGMRQLKEILRPYPRVRYPNICEDIMKIFVETGPGFDECVTYRRIEVDLKAPGIAGSPLELSKCRVEITAEAGDGRVEKFTLLDLPHALNGKLKVLYDRRYQRDFQDVQWYLSEHGEEIRGSGEILDEDGLRTFVDSLPSEKRTYWRSFLDFADYGSEDDAEHGDDDGLSR